MSFTVTLSLSHGELVALRSRLDARASILPTAREVLELLPKRIPDEPYRIELCLAREDALRLLRTLHGVRGPLRPLHERLCATTGDFSGLFGRQVCLAPLADPVAVQRSRLSASARLRIKEAHPIVERLVSCRRGGIER